MKRGSFVALLLLLTLTLTACPSVNDYAISELNRTVSNGVINEDAARDVIAETYMLLAAYMSLPEDGYTAVQEVCMESSDNPSDCLSDDFYINYFFNNPEWSFEDLIRELVLESSEEDYYIGEFLESLESETILVLNPILLQHNWGYTETVADIILERVSNSKFMDDFRESFVEKFRKISVPTTDLEVFMEPQMTIQFALPPIQAPTLPPTFTQVPVPTQPPQFTPLTPQPQYAAPQPVFQQPSKQQDCGNTISVKAAEWSPPREWTINRAGSTFMVSELNAASQYGLLDTLARAVLVEHMLIDMWSIQVHAYRDPLMYNPFKYMDSWDYPLAYYFYNTGRTLSEWWNWTVETSDFLSLSLNPRGYIDERKNYSDVTLSPSVLGYAWRDTYIHDYIAQRILDDSFVMSIKINFRQTFERLWDRVYAYNSFIADYDYVQDECPPPIQENTPQEDVSVILNNTMLDMSPSAKITNGRVMGSLYAIAAVLGDEVINIADNGQVGLRYISSGGGRPIVHAEIYAGLNYIKVVYEDGGQNTVFLDVPAYKQSNGTVMVPLEQFAQAVGATFVWDGRTRTALITWYGQTPPSEPTPIPTATPAPTTTSPSRFGS